MATVLVTGASGFHRKPYRRDNTTKQVTRLPALCRNDPKLGALMKFVDRLNVLKVDYSDATEWARIVGAVPA